MPPDLADISVIMPAYKAAGTIGRALASVAAQTVRPREVVVVDDGSPDGTVAVVESCRAQLAPTELVIVRLNSNQGAGAARNRALAAARGEWVAFLDADDEWLPGKLERSLAEWSADLAFVAHDMEIDGTLVDCARHFKAAGDPAEALFVRGFAATSTVVARRSAVLEAGGFDSGLRSGQDYDLWLGLAIAGRFRVFDGALTRYHPTPGSITTHVDRRRDCNMTILRRRLPALAARIGRRRALAAAFKRVAAIHWESWNGHRTAGRRMAAVAAVAEAPVNLVLAVMPARKGVAELVLWLWVAVIMAAYLWQFRDLAGPLVKLVGGA